MNGSWTAPCRYRTCSPSGGRLRQVGVADLLITAAAEASRVTVLHYDADFDAVAELTGQPTEWVVPRGAVP